MFVVVAAVFFGVVAQRESSRALRAASASCPNTQEEKAPTTYFLSVFGKSHFPPELAGGLGAVPRGAFLPDLRTAVVTQKRGKVSFPEAPTPTFCGARRQIVTREEDA